MIVRVLALMLILWTGPSWAAVVVTSSTGHVQSQVGQATSTTSTTVTGADTAIYVAVTRDATATVSSITHAGQALSPIASCTATPSDGFGRTEIWRRLSPASGTNDTVVTISSSTVFRVGIVTLAGVSQSATATCATPTSGTSTSPSITVTSASGEIVLAVMAASITGSPTATATGSQTSRWNTTFDGSIIAAGGTLAGTTSTVMSWSLSSSFPWIMTGLRIQASGPPDTQAPTAPTNLVANATSSSTVALSWTASTDNVAVVEYILQRSTTGCAGTFTELTRPVVTSYTDTGLTSNTAYCYRVFASDGTNTSAVSNTSSATTLAARTVQIGWTNNGTYTSLIVERCSPTGCNSYTDLATKTGSSTTHTDTDSPSPTACYRVRATLTGAPDSNPSNVVCTTAIPPAVLGVSPLSLTYNATVGGANPPGQTITITNSPDAQTMNWTVSDDASWLLCAPSSGTNNGSSTCSVNIAGLLSGTHLATITVAAPGATGNPQTVNVTLSLSPASQPGGTTPGSSQGGRIR